MNKEIERDIDDSEPEQDEDVPGDRRKAPCVECIMADRSPEDLRNHHPQRNTFDFYAWK